MKEIAGDITFSIAVVCLNPGKKLNETIDSILGQTYPWFEIIVKDGFSTDGSVEKLREDGRIRLVREKDRSIYEAMNQAVCHVSGDYVLFLNCGDYFYDRTVLEQVKEKIVEDRKSGGIYYGDIFNRALGAKIASNPHMDAFGCYRNVPCHQACFYRASLMKKIPYKPQYRVRGDYEHFLNCFFKEGVAPIYLPVMVASYEGGGYSETKENIRRSERERREIVRQYMKRGQRIRYGLILLVSLAPVRRKIAENKRLAGVYNRCKEWIYRRGNRT